MTAILNVRNRSGDYELHINDRCRVQPVHDKKVTLDENIGNIGIVTRRQVIPTKHNQNRGRVTRRFNETVERLTLSTGHFCTAYNAGY